MGHRGGIAATGVDSLRKKRRTWREAATAPTGT